MNKLFLLFWLFNCGIFAAEITLNDVRSLFQASVKDEAACKKLIDSIGQNEELEYGVFSAYKGCAEMIMARYCSDPLKKLSCFYSGKAILEKCIMKEPASVELRYLRFSIQSSSPEFLGYNKSIKEDKDFLMNQVKELTDLQLKEMITSFLKVSVYLSDTEKQKL